MSKRTALVGVVRRTGLEVLGWTLVLVGIAALVLPGPGLLTIVAGLVVLSQQYDWAERQLVPIKVRAYAGAREGVKTWPRVAVSVLSALVVGSVGWLFVLKPPVPDWWPAPESLWLVGGAGTGYSIIASAIFAIVLVFYSVRRFRRPPDQAERDVQQEYRRRKAGYKISRRTRHRVDS